MNPRLTLTGVFVTSVFLVSPFIDSLSGAMVLGGIIPEGGAGSPSQFLRLVILLLGFFVVLKIDKYFYTSIVLLFYIFFSESVFAFFHGSYFGFIIGLVYGSKIAYVLLVFFALRTIIESKSIALYSLHRYIFIYVTLTAVLLIVPFLFGVGFSTYREGTFGVKGFFSAGNGLGIFLGSGLLVLVYFWRLQGGFQYFSAFFVVLLATFIVGTKTSIIMGGAGIVALFNCFNRYLGVLLVFVIFFIVATYSDYLFDLVKLVYDVILFRYSNSDDILSFIFSNRDVYIHDALVEFDIDGLNAIRIFWGFGGFTSFRAPSASYDGLDVLESDLADLYFMYGFISMIYFGFIVWVIVKSLRARSYFLGFVFVLLSVHSILAGHVIFNGMSGTMFSLIAALIFTHPSVRSGSPSSHAGKFILLKQDRRAVISPCR